MVEVTPEELADLQRNRRGTWGEMSEHDKAICQADTPKKLVIPMDSAYQFRRIAPLLRELAQHLDEQSRRFDARERSIIMEARAECDEFNRKVRELSGKGKTKKPWQRENDPRFKPMPGDETPDNVSNIRSRPPR